MLKYSMIKNINEIQPHITFNDRENNEVHVIPVSLIRNVANNQHLADNKLVRLMAKIILDEL